MTDRPNTESPEPAQQRPGDAWREVGRQLEDLGRSLAAAFRTTWESEENRRHLRELQAGLGAMVKEVNQAVREAAASPEGQRVQSEVEKAARSARSALQQVSAEVQSMLGRLESLEPASEDTPEQQDTH